MSLKSWILTFAVVITAYVAVTIFIPKLARHKNPAPASPRPSPAQSVAKQSSEDSKSGESPLSSKFFLPQKTSPDGIPYFMEETVLTASFNALKKHGADLSKPMPSIHRVRCQDKTAIETVSRWAESAGFEVAKPELIHLHGGIENFMVDLVKTEVPNVSSIQNDGRRVAKAAHDLDGVTYSTWVGSIVQ